MIEQGFELRPGHGSLDDLAVVFAVITRGADHEGGGGADVVQVGLREVGVDHGLGGFALHAALQAIGVEAELVGDAGRPLAGEAGLLIEECCIHLPVTVLFTGAACSRRRRFRLLMEGEWQILVNETNQPGAHIVLLQLIEHLVVKAPAVGAFKIAELNDGQGGLGGAHGRLSGEQQCGAEPRSCGLYRPGPIPIHRGGRRDPALNHDGAATAETNTQG